MKVGTKKFCNHGS